MKYLRLLVILFILTLFVIGCSKNPKTELQVTFSEHPSGGIYVSTLSSVVKARIKFTEGKKFLFVSDGSPKPINLTIEWWAESLDRAHKVVYKSEVHTIESDDYMTITTSISAPDNMVFLGYFKAKAVWQDDEGSHFLNSGIAECTVGGLAKPSMFPCVKAN